jgi:TonB family protein
MKSGLSLIILYLFYGIAMRRATHFRLNRTILMFSMLLSLLVPIISLNIFNKPVLQASLPEFTVSLNEFVVNATKPVVQNTENTIDWWKTIFIIYLIGASIVLARLIYQGIYLHVISKLSKTVRKGNFTIVLMNADFTPFAYFGKIFIPASTADDFSINSIITHERSHQQQLHFIDLFVMQLVTVLQWFNPVVWLYERSLKEVHEYLADEAVLRQGQNKGIYQALLVNQAMGGPVFSLTNQFNKSLIKKRILMMTKMKTPRFAQLKALLILPLIALLLVAFANPKSMVNPVVQKRNELISSISKVSVNSPVQQDTTSKAIPNKDVPKQYAEQMPEFPGGQKAMMNFLIQNVKYPSAAMKNNVSGRVMVQYVVGSDGKIRNVKVLRGIGSGCDEEAVRVVKLFPTWKPGRDKGKNVSVYFTLPIAFSLSTDDKDKNTTGNHEKPLQYADQMPQFPGGQDSLRAFLSRNIKYPKEAIDKRVTGRVVTQFIIDKNGIVTSPKVLRGIGSGCDEEAIRVISIMPSWKPGSDKGKVVDAYFTLPIVFAQKD